MSELADKIKKALSIEVDQSHLDRIRQIIKSYEIASPIYDETRKPVTDKVAILGKFKRSIDKTLELHRITFEQLGIDSDSCQLSFYVAKGGFVSNSVVTKDHISNEFQGLFDDLQILSESLNDVLSSIHIRKQQGPKLDRCLIDCIISPMIDLYEYIVKRKATRVWNDHTKTESSKCVDFINIVLNHYNIKPDGKILHCFRAALNERKSA